MYKIELKYIIAIVVFWAVVVILSGWLEKRDKALTTYWTTQMEECRARGANFDLVGGVCKQEVSEIY